ncbi:MAG TPA: hypothetical protein VM867_07330 [Xanthobacteraceae bacterium]|jgi:hypothetical protein|nr:hypothetical protein [Xanthobacteraceae bacterium]
MQTRFTALAAAALIGATALAGATSAQAERWVLVPDDDDAPAVIYNSPRGYVAEPRYYRAPGSQYVQRPPARVAPPGGYLEAYEVIPDNCIVHKGPGLFGGTYETRECK